MPDDVQLALEARALTDEYLARPEYQQNEYIAWINESEHEDERIKRLNQMLDELAEGVAFMNKPYNAKV